MQVVVLRIYWIAACAHALSPAITHACPRLTGSTSACGTRCVVQLSTRVDRVEASNACSWLSTLLLLTTVQFLGLFGVLRLVIVVGCKWLDCSAQGL